jgi:hypothetical protein
MRRRLLHLVFRGARVEARRRILYVSLSDTVLRWAMRTLRGRPEVVYRTRIDPGDRFEIVAHPRR